MSSYHFLSEMFFRTSFQPTPSRLASRSTELGHMFITKPNIIKGNEIDSSANQAHPLGSMNPHDFMGSPD